MNRIYKIFLNVVIFICVISSFSSCEFMVIGFIGKKDQKIAQESVKRMNNILLSAEYRIGADYCKVDILDSLNIEINVGDQAGGIVTYKNYKIFNDTIEVIGGLEQVWQYLNTNKFLIQHNKLLFKLNLDGSYDTTTTMKIKFNKIKL